MRLRSCGGCCARQCAILLHHHKAKFGTAMNAYWKWIAIALFVALVLTLIITFGIIQGVMDFGLSIL